MKILKFSPANEQEILIRALAVLASGGVLCHATDTCYGLAADPWNEQAFEKVFAIKAMQEGRAVTLLCADAEQAKKYGEFSAVADALAQRLWPGALTLVVKKREDVFPRYFNGGSDTVGLRVPAHDFSRALARDFGQPLTTTSANRTGEPPCYKSADVMRIFSAAPQPCGRGPRGITCGPAAPLANPNPAPDLFIDFGDLDENSSPSTVVDVSGLDVPLILRQGGVHL